MSVKTIRISDALQQKILFVKAYVLHVFLIARVYITPTVPSSSIMFICLKMCSVALCY